MNINIMEKTQKETEGITDMKKRCEDILVAISWMEIANTYFHRNSSWVYSKMNGKDVVDGVKGFTPEEAEQLRGALCDLAERIRRCAANI